MSLQDIQNGTNSYDPTSSHEDFLEQMLCGLQSGVSWPDISAGADGGGGVGQSKPALPWDVDHFEDQSTYLASKLRQHQISPGTGGAAKSLLLQQQLLLSRGLGGAGDSGLFENDMVDASSFKSPNGDNLIQTLFNGFSGSLQSNQIQDFHFPPAQNFGSPAAAAALTNQGQPPNGSTAAGGGGGGGGLPVQPRQRVRARRGQATDPHSIAERLRRERIAERMKSLQELVPNANKTDKASMLDEIIDYVKFLQLQVKVLSMSRLGGAAAVSPLVADIEGGRDGSKGGGSGSAGRSTNVTASSSNNDTMTVAENQVVKLMEEDMGSAMQYLQGKGLCLMPISLATAISTATCQPSSSRNNHRLLGGGDGGSPNSPNMSVLSVQSANGVLPPDVVSAVKDSTSVSKP